MADPTNSEECNRQQSQDLNQGHRRPGAGWAVPIDIDLAGIDVEYVELLEHDHLAALRVPINLNLGGGGAVGQPFSSPKYRDLSDEDQDCEEGLGLAWLSVLSAFSV